jgi:hypothetical protein
MQFVLSYRMKKQYTKEGNMFESNPLVIQYATYMYIGVIALGIVSTLVMLYSMKQDLDKNDQETT